MKKIQKFVLNENAEILNKEEMKLLLGGGVYRCTCYSSSYILYWDHDIPATDIGDAMDSMEYACSSGNYLCRY